MTRQLPFRWHNSPNIHCLSLKDFEDFCERLGVIIEHRIPIVRARRNPVRLTPNLFAEQVIYMTSKKILTAPTAISSNTPTSGD